MFNPFDLFGGFFAMFGGLFVVFGLASVGIFVLVAGLIIRSVSAAAATNAQNDASPIVDSYARVVTKRTRVSGNEHSFTHYYATFEFENGQRIEFPVKGQQYGMLAEGDSGTLRHQGTRYLGFSRH